MRITSLVFVAVFTLSTLSTAAQQVPAVSYRWIAGLDLFAALPNTPNVLAFDRDAGLFSVLYVTRGCYTTFPLAEVRRTTAIPSRDGAIVALFPLTDITAALYYESGRLEQLSIPADRDCVSIVVLPD